MIIIPIARRFNRLSIYSEIIEFDDNKRRYLKPIFAKWKALSNNDEINLGYISINVDPNTIKEIYK